VLQTLEAKGDLEGAEHLRQQLGDVEKAIEDVDYRSANIRAGYVYVISNVGAFGERMVEIGMTRRLEPMDRVKELSVASVPFNFDVHALFFSNDAVGIEAAMHTGPAHRRVNRVNMRREFFYATPAKARGEPLKLAGDLLQFEDLPEPWSTTRASTSPPAAEGTATPGPEARLEQCRGAASENQSDWLLGEAPSGAIS
jgi:Meiotically up-regulated gene 113